MEAAGLAERAGRECTAVTLDQDAVGPVVPSPCIRECKVDKQSGLCSSCWRSLEEIGAWSRMDQAGRRQVRILIERRATTAGGNI